MPKHPSTTARLTAVQAYLEEEFPGRVQDAEENVIVVSHDGIRHHVELQPTFLHQCPDHIRAIRDSELADYMREARSQERRFLVIWTEHDTRIRSAPL
jgi:hypothetical protein